MEKNLPKVLIAFFLMSTVFLSGCKKDEPVSCESEPPDASAMVDGEAFVPTAGEFVIGTYFPDGVGQGQVLNTINLWDANNARIQLFHIGENTGIQTLTGVSEVLKSSYRDENDILYNVTSGQISISEYDNSGPGPVSISGNFQFSAVNLSNGIVVNISNGEFQSITAAE